MASINLESMPPNFKTSVAELIRGREAATQLAILLQEALPGSEAAVDEVIGSISRGISALGASGAEPVVTASPCSLDGRNVSSGGNRKAPMRRGAYKKRSRGHPYSWTKITSKSVDDGFTWRKYGQKEIYGAKFQRSYYRCTHKPAGCPAMRQVQQSEEDPWTFNISYMGEHTCRQPAAGRPPYLISFASGEGSSVTADGGNLVQSQAAFSFPSMKEEAADEQVVSSQAPSSSCSEYVVLPSAVQYEGSVASKMQGSDNGDVTSGFHSDDVWFDMISMFDVDELLNLDQDGLF